MKRNKTNFNITNNEKIPQMVNGYFKIEVKDKHGKILNSYEDKNKIMVWIHEMFSDAVYGYNPPNIEDFIITTIALGTDGIDSNGIPKDLPNNMQRMYSEDNFWNYNVYAPEKAYVYQATWDTPQTDIYGSVEKLNEGATVPHMGGVPLYYRGNPVNDEESYAGLKVYRGFSNGILQQKFILEVFSGNGHPMWAQGPGYSEAALYTKKGATESGEYLGTMFSMKTFPEMIKTEDCVISIQWDLDFNI